MLSWWDNLATKAPAALVIIYQLLLVGELVVRCYCGDAGVRFCCWWWREMRCATAAAATTAASAIRVFEGV